MYSQKENEPAVSRGAASDPTAAVNFQDIRFRYLDLGDDKHRRWYNTEGGYMVSQKFKIINELHYWDTNLSGSSEANLESFHIKGIYLTPGPQVGKATSRFAVGAEWVKELGSAKDGTSSGADQIAPFTGFGWQLSKIDTLITLVQYFGSYKEESGVEPISRTGPRMIYIHSIPSRQSWLRVDDNFVIDHKADNASSNTLEVQYGKMLTSRVGIYADALYQTGGFQQYDWGGWCRYPSDVLRLVILN